MCASANVYNTDWVIKEEGRLWEFVETADRKLGQNTAAKASELTVAIALSALLADCSSDVTLVGFNWLFTYRLVVEIPHITGCLIPMRRFTNVKENCPLEDREIFVSGERSTNYWGIWISGGHNLPPWRREGFMARFCAFVEVMLLHFHWQCTLVRSGELISLSKLRHRRSVQFTELSWFTIHVEIHHQTDIQRLSLLFFKLALITGLQTQIVD